MILSAIKECMLRMSKKLNNDPSTPPKSSVLNWFLNNKKITKLFQSFVTVNSYQTSKRRPIYSFFLLCTPAPNSVLPGVNFHANTRLSLFSIKENGILAIIVLNTKKSHGWDNNLIQVIQIYEESLALPLKISFEAALNDTIFPYDWKKSNIVPVHKKGLKNMLKNIVL